MNILNPPLTTLTHIMLTRHFKCFDNEQKQTKVLYIAWTHSYLLLSVSVAAASTAAAVAGGGRHNLYWGGRCWL